MSPRDADLGMGESVPAPMGGSKTARGAVVAAYRVRARDG